MADDRITSIEERVGILRVKAEREKMDVPTDVLEYIASKHTLAHSLKGALVQVMGFAAVKRTPIDIALARRALGDTVPVDSEETAASEERADGEAVVASRQVAVGVPDADVVDEPETLVPETVASHAPDRSADLSSPTQPSLDLSAGFAISEPMPRRRVSRVFFTPMRTEGKKSLVTRAGRLLERAGLADAIEDDDLVAIKLHFGEQGNTGFVNPVFLREVVAKVRDAGGKPFLTDSNTLYRGQRFNAVDHVACAVHNGFSYATVDAPVIIADGLDGREAVDVPVSGKHFDTVRLGAAGVHADAMVVVTHVKGHEATGFGGALKNVGMGLGCRSAKQRMHSDFMPQPNAEKCTGCDRCVKWCPVYAIAVGPDRVARVDYDLCYGCGECVAACPHGAIAIQWKTSPHAIQEKIVEHVAGALSDKAGKVLFLSFVTNVSPDCDCWHFSDASIVPDVGVLASADIVAIDQAAYDLVAKAPGLAGTRGEGLSAGTDKFAEVTGIDGTIAMKYAEEMGLGTREYELETVE